MALIEVGVIPLGTETPSVSKYVAGAVKILQDARDIKYELTAMGTIIEGDLKPFAISYFNGFFLNISRTCCSAWCNNNVFI